MITKQGLIFDYSTFRHSDKGESGRPGFSLTRIMAFAGNFLIFISILGFTANFGPMLYHEASFGLKQIRGIEYKITNPPLGGFSGKTGPTSEVNIGTKQQTLIPKDTSFNILIPKLGLNEKIFANVDVSNEDEYSSVLKKGAAHAKGTYFPGQEGNIYIFAHSGENFWDGINSKNTFYLLKDLQPEDEIVIFFNNKPYNYTVYKSEITSPSETSFITQAKTGEERLILQTCWPPLTTWNRLLVFAKPAAPRLTLF